MAEYVNGLRVSQQTLSTGDVLRTQLEAFALEAGEILASPDQRTTLGNIIFSALQSAPTIDEQLAIRDDIYRAIQAAGVEL